MPPRPEPLNALRVKTAKPGRYGDGGKLYLLVRSAESAWWVFRYTAGGKLREMGLGPARGRSAVPLSEARLKAAALFKSVRDGGNPLNDREAEEAAAAAQAQQAAIAARTFREAAETFIEGNKAGWRNAKHAAQWSATLATYAYPHFGDVPVVDVATAHVMAALEPIWRTKPETAVRLRGRIETVLNAEKARGTRSGENPARWRGHLDQLLPARSKVAPVEHHPALPYAELPAFLPRLQAADGLGARALEFAILTAARSGEVLGATWGEIDLAEALWTIPAERMKAGREHRVPLSPPALALLGKMATLRATDSPAEFVFPGARDGRGLSNMAMTATLRRMKRGDLTAHGFRSCFRDWVAETTAFPSEVAEMALAHAVGNAVEAAYRRGDLFEKRRKMMDAWANYCTRPGKTGGDAVPMRKRMTG